MRNLAESQESQLKISISENQPRKSQKSQLNNNITKINEILNSENNTTENIKIMKKQQNMGKEQIQMFPG